MALVHKLSPQCTIQQLELFRALPTCTQVQQAVSVPHYTVTSLDSANNVLEFLVQGTGDQYVDLARTRLHIKFSIRDGGKKIAAGAKVAPVANFLSTMFNQCEIFLNDKLVTSSNNMYPYRAYVETLLNHSDSTGKNQLTAQMWYRDTAGAHNSSTDNDGYKHRSGMTAGSVTCEVRGPLLADLCSQGGYLVNNVDVRIRLTRSPDAFCLMAFDADAVDADAANNVAAKPAKQYQVRIEEAVLLVSKMTLNPANQLAVESTLRRQNALYNLQRTEIKSFTIAKGDTSFTREHINLGLSPRYAVIGLVATEAAQGAYKQNPFNFQHFNIRHIALNIDGEQVPRGGINCDFDANSYLDAYESLVDVVGRWKTDAPFALDRDEYKNGYVLFGFQIAPELVDGAFNLVRNTNIRLDLQFAKALPTNITAIIWFVYDAVLEVDKDREIHYDFSS